MDSHEESRNEWDGLNNSMPPAAGVGRQVATNDDDNDGVFMDDHDDSNVVDEPTLSTNGADTSTSVADDEKDWLLRLGEDKELN